MHQNSFKEIKIDRQLTLKTEKKDQKLHKQHTVVKTPAGELLIDNSIRAQKHHSQQIQKNDNQFATLQKEMLNRSHEQEQHQEDSNTLKVGQTPIQDLNKIKRQTFGLQSPSQLFEQSQSSQQSKPQQQLQQQNSSLTRQVDQCFTDSQASLNEQQKQQQIYQQQQFLLFQQQMMQDSQMQQDQSRQFQNDLVPRMSNKKQISVADIQGAPENQSNIQQSAQFGQKLLIGQGLQDLKNFNTLSFSGISHHMTPQFYEQDTQFFYPQQQANQMGVAPTSQSQQQNSLSGQIPKQMNSQGETYMIPNFNLGGEHGGGISSIRTSNFPHVDVNVNGNLIYSSQINAEIIAKQDALIEIRQGSMKLQQQPSFDNRQSYNHGQGQPRNEVEGSLQSEPDFELTPDIGKQAVSQAISDSGIFDSHQKTKLMPSQEMLRLPKFQNSSIETNSMSPISPLLLKQSPNQNISVDNGSRHSAANAQQKVSLMSALTPHFKEVTSKAVGRTTVDAVERLNAIRDSRRKSKNSEGKALKEKKNSGRKDYKRQNTPQLNMSKQASNMYIPEMKRQMTKSSIRKTSKPNFNHSKSLGSHKARQNLRDEIDENDSGLLMHNIKSRSTSQRQNLYEDSDVQEDENSNLYNNTNNMQSYRKSSTIVNHPPSNEEYTEVIKSFMRARLDSLLGLSHNFLNQNQEEKKGGDFRKSESHKLSGAAIAAAIDDKFGSTGEYKIFDLGNQQFKDCTLQDVLAFNNQLMSIKPFQKRPSLLLDTESAKNYFNQLHLSKYPSAVQNNYSHYMILMTNINEGVLTSILTAFHLNPILLWEIILKQQYDKVFYVDEDTVFYNIEIIEENQLQKKFVVKLVHLIQKNTILIFTDSSGFTPMMDLMKKIFKFESLDEYFNNMIEKISGQGKRHLIVGQLTPKSKTNVAQYQESLGQQSEISLVKNQTIPQSNLGENSPDLYSRKGATFEIQTGNTLKSGKFLDKNKINLNFGGAANPSSSSGQSQPGLFSALANAMSGGGAGGSSSGKSGSNGGFAEHAIKSSSQNVQRASDKQKRKPSREESLKDQQKHSSPSSKSGKAKHDYFYYNGGHLNESNERGKMRSKRQSSKDSAKTRQLYQGQISVDNLEEYRIQKEKPSNADYGESRVNTNEDLGDTSRKFLLQNQMDDMLMGDQSMQLEQQVSARFQDPDNQVDQNQVQLELKRKTKVFRPSQFKEPSSPNGSNVFKQATFAFQGDSPNNSEAKTGLNSPKSGNIVRKSQFSKNLLVETNFNLKRSSKERQNEAGTPEMYQEISQSVDLDKLEEEQAKQNAIENVDKKELKDQSSRSRAPLPPGSGILVDKSAHLSPSHENKMGLPPKKDIKGKKRVSILLNQENPPRIVTLSQRGHSNISFQQTSSSSSHSSISEEDSDADQESQTESDCSEEDESDSDVTQFVNGKGMLRKSRRVGATKFSCSGDQGKLMCEDILYGIMDESMRKIEPIIVRFEREAQALNNLSLNLSHYEKQGYARRSHMAKDIMLHFHQNLKIKNKFFKELEKQHFISTKMKILLRFLMGRLYNSEIIMERAQGLINLSDQTYENMVDISLNEQTNSLNKVMKGLTVLTVLVIPYNIIAGFFGMNVLVPFSGENYEESLIPFFMLLLFSTISAIILFFGLKHFKWL